ncbi:MAG: S1 RNA-binding domain-containing protein [Patescibacteria group bacterium]
MNNNDNNKELDNLLKGKDFKNPPKVEDLIKAKVVGIKQGEVYLDVDGIFTGMVRGRELVDESGQFSNLKVGDEVIATVVELENEKGVMELSFRSAGHQQAWQTLEDLKNSKKIVEVKILSANKGGLLVQLDRVQGFLPVSQLSSEHYPRVEGGNKAKILEKLRSFINSKFKVKILDLDEKEEKLIVSEKDVFAEERAAMLETIKVNDIISGKVTAVVDFGAFIEFKIGKNKTVEGLIHISELAWQRIDHPRDILKVEDEIKAQIISIDNGRVSLSLKKLQEDPWKKAAEKYQIGQTAKGKVLKTDKFGAFVELDEDIHGLAHISELSDKQIDEPSDIVEVGKEYDFKIVSIEADDHRLGLSMKKDSKPEEKKEDKKEGDKTEKTPEVEEKKEEKDKE